MKTYKKLSLAQCLLIAAGLGLCFWSMEVGLVIGLLWLLPIAVTIDLGYTRNRTGWLWGLFLGWLGVVIMALGYMPSAAERSARARNTAAARRTRRAAV
jgi:hypothetical protein